MQYVNGGQIKVLNMPAKKSAITTYVQIRESDSLKNLVAQTVL